MDIHQSSVHFKTVSQMHGAIGIEMPKHPLFSILRFEDLPEVKTGQRTRLISDFYQISLKMQSPCKMQYGQTTYDFDEGVISCFAPKQVSFIDEDFVFAKSGWILTIHPDFLLSYPLGKKIKDFGFFDYAVNEALIMSDDEQKSVETIFEQIDREYRLPIDNFSQDLIIAILEVLLSYCNRYYNRQFITRKVVSNDLLSRFERILKTHIDNEIKAELPTASALAAELNMSSKYLSDCLRQLTGQTTKQLIHEKLVEQAKMLLSTTELSVSEIAYRLGFEYSQSFSKLFKNKTNQTPVEFRHLFN